MFPFHNAVFEFWFRTEGKSDLSVIYNATGSLVGQVVLRPQLIRLSTGQPERAGEPKQPDDVSAMDTARLAIEAGKWHTLVVELRGKRMIAQLDDKARIVSENALLDVDKDALWLYVDGAGASFDYIRAYEISSKD
jgi:hypothetical protein